VIASAAGDAGASAVLAGVIFAVLLFVTDLIGGR